MSASQSEDATKAEAADKNSLLNEKIVELHAYLPIPINFNNYAFAEAPNRIIYDSRGTNPSFYNNYLQLFKYDETLQKNMPINDCEWVIGVDGEVSYDPSLGAGYVDKTPEEQEKIKEQQRLRANWKSYYPK